MSNNQLTRTQQSITRATSLRDRITKDHQHSGTSTMLLDISGSMREVIDIYNTKSPRKIDILWQIVQQLRSENQQLKIATFNTETEWSDLVTCPQPEEGTILVQALQFICKPQAPEQMTIITDGLPYDQEKALEFARELNCKINVLYVGPKSNKRAIGFCSRLASMTGGSFAVNGMNTEMLQIEAAKQIAEFIEAPIAIKSPVINL